MQQGAVNRARLRVLSFVMRKTSHFSLRTPSRRAVDGAELVQTAKSQRKGLPLVIARRIIFYTEINVPFVRMAPFPMENANVMMDTALSQGSVAAGSAQQ